ncbi:hypothetical protein ACFO3U_08285 [Flavobacterium ponti]|uniref:Nucleotide modification associated domain-containing protein n=1 Tax=Flavobacterium ponti TaxID=665133 RepID=A0ABV9P545_9FLAO
MNNSRIYLNSFNPLIINNCGKIAIDKYNFPLFIDGSCRREPDFENELPSITGLCRPGFAEKLKEKDIIVYVTNKKGIGVRKVIAVLEVIKIFENHRQAADWYIKENKPIPNNIMVDETKPFDLDKTHQIHRIKDITNDIELLKKWNLLYELRGRKKQKVVQCGVLYKELFYPITLDESKFKRKLTAQNPPILNEKDWKSLKELIQL